MTEQSIQTSFARGADALRDRIGAPSRLADAGAALFTLAMALLYLGQSGTAYRTPLNAAFVAIALLLFLYPQTLDAIKQTWRSSRALRVGAALLGAFALWSSASVLWATLKPGAAVLPKIIEPVASIGVFSLCAVAIGANASPLGLRRLGVVAALFAAVHAGTAIIGYALGAETHFGRMQALYGLSPIADGAFWALAAALVAALGPQFVGAAPVGRRRWALWAIACLLATAAIMTQSRSTYLVMIAMPLVLVLADRTAAARVLIACIVGVLLGFSALLAERAIKTWDDAEASLAPQRLVNAQSPRIAIWSNVWTASTGSTEQFLFGAGRGSDIYFEGPEGWGGAAEPALFHPHSTSLTALWLYGFVGLSLLGGSLLAFLLESIRQIRIGAPAGAIVLAHLLALGLVEFSAVLGFGGWSQLSFALPIFILLATASRRAASPSGGRQ